MPSAPRPRPARPLILRWTASLAASALALAAPLAAPPTVAAHSVVAQGSSSAAEAPDTSAAPAPDAPHILVDDVTPWVEKDGALTVTGRIVNPTAHTFQPARVAVNRSASRLSIRDDVRRWAEQQASSQLLTSSDEEVPDPTDDPAGDSADDASDAGQPALVVPTLPESIDPGQQVEFRFTIPADRFSPGGSAGSTWGAYGLSVTMRGALESDAAPGEVGGAVTDSAPAYSTWYPDPGIDPTRITTVIPVTLDTTAEDGGPLIPADVLERATDPDATGDLSGALDRVLAGARALPESTLAVDPRLLVSAATALDVAVPSGTGDDQGEEQSSGPGDTNEAQPGATTTTDGATTPDSTGDGADPGEGASGADDPQPTATAPAKEAREAHPHLAGWWDDLRALAKDHDVIALPWADAHLTALRAAGMDDLSAEALDDRAVVSELLGGRTTVLWPSAGTVRTDDLGALAAAGAESVILSDTQQPSLTSYTSSANSAIAADGGRPATGTVPNAADRTTVLQSLIADSGLAEAAAGQAAASPDAPPGQLLALSAVITSERPYDSRSLLLTLPRTAAGSGLTAVTRDLSTAPWITDTTLDELQDTEPVARGALVEPPEVADAADSAESQQDQRTDQSDRSDVESNEQSGAQQPDEPGAQSDALSGDHARDAQTILSSLQQQFTSGAAASRAFVEADAVRHDMSRALLACTSAGVVDGGRIRTCADSASGWVDALATGVKPEPGSSVLLVTGEQAMIPVRVDNATDRTAQVRLRVESPTPQLSTEVSEAVTLGPGEARSVDVPVRGLANADVRSTITLLTVDGETLPQRTELLVRVRADWENTATIAVGSVLVTVLVVGVVMTIRRGRRKIPSHQLEAAMARAQDG